MESPYMFVNISAVQFQMAFHPLHVEKMLYLEL